MDIRLKRAYEPAAAADGYRILIDRLWPRGVTREEARLDEWARELAPSSELRRWFGHDPARFEDFRRRYAEELALHEAKLRELRQRARDGTLTLVYGARDTEHNDAVVLAEILRSAVETRREVEELMSERSDPALAAEELQDELRDLLAMAVVGDHVRWVAVDDGAAELADWLAEAVPQWRAIADRVAKHLVTLGVAPDGRLRSLATDIPVHWVPDGWLNADDARRLVADRLAALAGWARYRRSQATDPDTAQLLDAVCSSLGRSP